MKFKRFVPVLVFLVCSAVICVMIAGLFLLSGGSLPKPPEQIEPPAVEPPKPPLATVIIDAGHGGEDGGAVGVTGLVEKDLNLDLACRVAALLEADGVRVIMTRKTDVLLYDRNTDYQGRKKVLDLAARQAVGDAYPEALFVSIHANAFSEQQYHGLQIWYGSKNAKSAVLADHIRCEVVQELQPDNHRQSKQAGNNIYLLYHLQNPAVLVECGFLSNPTECRALEDENYRQALAHALYRGILAYAENDVE